MCFKFKLQMNVLCVLFSVRGKYFHRQPGGHFESPDCLPGDRVDCLWVIGSPSEVGASRVLVNFEENHCKITVIVGF